MIWTIYGVILFFTCVPATVWLVGRARRKKEEERRARENEAKREAELEKIAEEMGFSGLDPVARHTMAEQELEHRLDREKTRLEKERQLIEQERELQLLREFQPRFEDIIDQMGFNWSMKAQGTRHLYDLDGWLVILDMAGNEMRLRQDREVHPIGTAYSEEDFDKVIASFAREATPRIRDAKFQKLRREPWIS